MQKTIFVVDDNDTNLAMAKDVLKEQYRVMTLPSAAKMFALLDKIKPDLILLDIEMPEIDGFEALQRLKNGTSHADIPVIFLTGIIDPETEVRGFQLGVVDFVGKPFSAPVLLNRIKTHLDIDALIRERTARLRRLKDGIVFVLADILESRDKGTGGHVERTTAFVGILAKAMQEQNLFTDEIKNIDAELFVASARLHDVGKISISDTILNKPAGLSGEEFEIMKTHTTEGERIIQQIVSRTGESEVFLYHAKLFAGYHHERWDGSGYPYGLEGTNIPIEGRVMALADAYDALISERSYKKPFSHGEAVKIIQENVGKQFDPAIVDLFCQVHEKFQAVKLRAYPR